LLGLTGTGAPRPKLPLGTGAPPRRSKRDILSFNRVPALTSETTLGEGDGERELDEDGATPLLACKAAIRSFKVLLQSNLTVSAWVQEFRMTESARNKTNIGQSATLIKIFRKH
jgi:hypothetical protein